MDIVASKVDIAEEVVVFRMEARARISPPSRPVGLVGIQDKAAIAENVPAPRFSIRYWGETRHDEDINSVLVGMLPDWAQVLRGCEFRAVGRRLRSAHTNLESCLQE